jgi:Fic family protein
MVKLETIAKIDDVISRINIHPEYSRCVRGETDSALLSEASRHSMQMELPRRLSRKEYQRAVSQGLANLGYAWQHLVNNGLSLLTLDELGHKVEPKGHTYSRFRNTEVVFGAFVGTSKSRIYDEVDGLIWNLENLDIHPVLRAAEAHIGLVKIHPYEDGNGRAARLLQNFCLNQKGLPAAVIKANEKREYLEIISAALRDRYAGRTHITKPSDSEKVFHDYIAGKILDSAIHMEQVLAAKRVYDIVISDVSGRQVPQSLADRIREMGRKPGSQGVKVSVNARNNGRRVSNIRVVGNVSAEEIRRTLDRSKSDLGFRYSVSSDLCGAGVR